MRQMKHSPIRWRHQLLVSLFRLLEHLAALRTRVTSGASQSATTTNPPPDPGHQNGSLWVFASTIGELTLIEPVLRALLAERPGLPLTLISDRATYRESFARKFPNAYVYNYAATLEDTRRLMMLSPPFALIVVEIPCLPGDAPCRLAYSAVHELRKRRVPIVLLNGWLYGYRPRSRLDRLERDWFASAYVQSMDLITVQNEETRGRLIAEGADPSRVHTTGNTKFDAFEAASDWSPSGRPSEHMLSGLLESTRPVVVAGCVTDRFDQALVTDAFTILLRTHPDALLVTAPRHPENPAVIEYLTQALSTRELTARRRTELQDGRLSDQVLCLVLDTFGELRDFYAVSDATFVGPNHNLLEPLAFGRSTTTRPGWDSTYPSYPVYLALRDADAIRECDQADGLAAIWREAITDRKVPPTASDRESAIHRARALAERLSGATRKTIPLLVAAIEPGLTQDFGCDFPDQAC